MKQKLRVYLYFMYSNIFICRIKKLTIETFVISMWKGEKYLNDIYKEN